MNKTANSFAFAQRGKGRGVLVLLITLALAPLCAVAQTILPPPLPCNTKC